MLGLAEPMSVDFTNSSWLTYEQIASQIVSTLSLVPVFGEFASATQEIIETSGEQLVWRNELEGNQIGDEVITFPPKKETLQGPSDRIRTCGILLPKRFSAFFIVVYSNL